MAKPFLKPVKEKKITLRRDKKTYQQTRDHR